LLSGCIGCRLKRLAKRLFVPFFRVAVATLIWNRTHKNGGWCNQFSLASLKHLSFIGLIFLKLLTFQQN
jgi:hypothetical protein